MGHTIPLNPIPHYTMKTAIIFTIMLLITLVLYLFLSGSPNQEAISADSIANVVDEANQSTSTEEAKATFGGGCFWCLEGPYDKLEGVLSTVSGYAGGHTSNPTYREVSSGRTGHTEVVQVTYDPSIISFQELLDVFWLNIDPTTRNSQFCDVGTQYRTAIYSHDEAQAELAIASAKAIEASAVLPGPVVTEIEPLKVFYPAEDYHQDYYIKNPLRYNFYRTSCGRDRRLNELWGEAASH